MERQRRLRHSGSIFQRSSDGLWCATLAYPTKRGEKRRRKTIYGRTRAEVEAKLNAALEDSPPPPERTRSEVMFEARELGRHAPKDWAEVRASAEGVCFYCRESVGEDNLYRDHMVPVARGGSDSIENIVPACIPCNVRKHFLTAVEYITHLALRGESTVG